MAIFGSAFLKSERIDTAASNERNYSSSAHFPPRSALHGLLGWRCLSHRSMVSLYVASFRSTNHSRLEDRRGA